MPDTYSPTEIAERYAVSVGTVAVWIHTGELAAINASRSLNSRKRRWRITRRALDEFEHRRAATPPTPPPPQTRKQRKKTSDVIEFYK